VDADPATFKTELISEKPEPRGAPAKGENPCARRML
jgi:hypothetical protein